jgi:hypothetical protein
VHLHQACATIQQGGAPCPPFGHSSASRSGISSPRSCPNRKLPTHSAATAPHPRPGRLRQAPPSARVRLRLPAHRRRYRLMQHLERIALDAYDRMIGLDLGNLAVDGCTTKAPCGGQTAGPSPVDRGKQGLKRSMVTDARGIPLGAVPAPANRSDHALLGATLEALPPLGPLPAGGTVHLDRGYDYRAVRDGLAARPARADRRAWQARPDPGRAPLGHRAYPRVDEQLRQAHPLHRAPQARGRVLPRSRHRHRHARSSHPPGLILLPVADTTSAPPLKPRLLAHLLREIDSRHRASTGVRWVRQPYQKRPVSDSSPVTRRILLGGG